MEKHLTPEEITPEEITPEEITPEETAPQEPEYPREEVYVGDEDFSLEDIMKEFGADPADTPAAEPAEEPAEEPTEEQAQESPDPLAGDTVRLDTADFAQGKVRNAAPITDEEDAAPTENPEIPELPEIPETPESPADTQSFSGQWEPEYEQPMGEYIPPQPIIFHPKSRIRELKRKLVAGPERRYYQLAELGLGKLQVAIFFSLLVVLLAAASTVMYALDLVPENRLRLMIFGQCLAMLLSALLGCNRLIDGVTDLFKQGFTMNTLLLLTFVICCVDGVLCLQQLRVPFCAAFCLEMTMSLWSCYQRRNTEMGQMDTMRKAHQLDKLSPCPDYHEGRKGFLRSEGQVEDFMDTYAAPSLPEKILNLHALIACLLACAVGVTAGVLYGLSEGIRIAAISMLAAVPVAGFVAYTRPFGVLERRLHSVGTVLCGWQGVQGLAGKVMFSVDFADLFPAGTTKMNGVKFFTNRSPDQIVAYCTALICASGSGLSPVFTQVLDSRNGRHYDPVNLRSYDNGGIGGEVCGESVLVGSLKFLKEMGVEIPEGIRVSNVVCVAIDGELCGLFAVTYERTRSAAMGLRTLCSHRGLTALITAEDFMLDTDFIAQVFGIRSKRLRIPTFAQRLELKGKTAGEDAPALLLTTRDGLLPYAYGVAGARALRRASRAGIIIHILGSAVGLGIMLTLTLLGRLDLLTPAQMFAYQLLWLIPGFLATTWTRSI